MYGLYLRSLGWALTKWLRKKDHCERIECRTRRLLDLHHDGYEWHNRHPFLRWFFPNMVDPMRTLCRKHHSRIHRAGPVVDRR